MIPDNPFKAKAYGFISACDYVLRHLERKRDKAQRLYDISKSEEFKYAIEEYSQSIDHVRWLQQTERDIAGE